MGQPFSKFNNICLVKFLAMKTLHVATHHSEYIHGWVDDSVVGPECCTLLFVVVKILVQSTTLILSAMGTYMFSYWCFKPDYNSFHVYRISCHHRPKIRRRFSQRPTTRFPAGSGSLYGEVQVEQVWTCPCMVRPPYGFEVSGQVESNGTCDWPMASQSDRTPQPCE